MPSIQVNVLGPVAVLRDGQPVPLHRQPAMALAILIAARGKPVRRDVLASAIWPDEDSGPAHDGLAPVMSRLRAQLAGGGLDIPPARGSGSYRLISSSGPDRDTAVDAVRFEACWRTGTERLAAGDEPGALECFAAAAAEWSGAPFDTEWQDQLPYACDAYRRKLEEEYDDLVRRVSEIALRRGGRYADALIGPPRPEAEPPDAAWLVALLTTLRDDGVAAAERAIERRRGGPAGAGGDVTDRARDLVLLRRANVDVHRPLHGAPGPRSTGSPLEIVGRAAELGALRGLLAAVAGGRPATMTVRGPSGSGKTRLLAELAADGASGAGAGGGVRVIMVRRRAPGDLQPWRDLAGTLWAAARRDIANGPDPLSPAQRRVLTEFVTGPAEHSGPDQAHQRQLAELALALRALLLQAAKPHGLVVGFDDAEQLTERGHQLLHEIRTRMADEPIGWLLIGRDDAAWSDPPALAPAEARPGLLLRPLAPEGVRQWMRQVWPREPTDEETTRIWERTRGLPVNLCEIGGPADGARPGEPLAGAGPAGWRLDPPSAWVTAAAITATGLDVDTALVAGMLELGEAAADRAQAAAIADWPIDATGGVRFRHGKWRALAASALDEDPAFQRHLHRRAFEVLRRRPVPAGRDADLTLPVRLAEHARGADRDLPGPDVVRAYLAAARAEQASLSTAAAIRWARAGLALAADAGTRFELYMALGDAHNDGGAMREAGLAYQQAHEAARGRPRAQAAAAISLARRWSDPGQADDDLLYVLRAGLDGLGGLAGEDDADVRALRLQLAAHLAHKSAMAVPAQEGPQAAGDQGAPEDGAALARQALAELTPDLPPIVRCEVLNECRWGVYDYAPPTETIKISRQLRSASTAARSSYFRSEALIAVAIDQLRLGHITQAQATIVAHRQHITQNHRAMGTWLQGALDVLMDLWHGRFEAAEQRLFGESLAAVEQARADQSGPADTLLQTWQGQVFWLLRERGRAQELLAAEAAETIADHAHFPIWRAAMILACCETGRLDEAAGRLTALAYETDGLATLPPHGWTVPTAAVLAECCLALTADGPGSPAWAAAAAVAPRLRTMLAAYHGEFVLVGWPVVLMGPVIRFSGILATALGDYAEAIRLFDQALPIVGDARPQVTRLRLDKARALIRAGQAPATAARLLSQAAEEAERLGMPAIRQEARQLLGNL